MTNKELCEKFPFIQYEEGKYDYTFLDDIPIGWRKTIGIPMCEEIAKELKWFPDFNYQVLQVKEKFGGLRWYDAGIPDKCAIHSIVHKYEIRSYSYCMNCGAPSYRSYNIMNKPTLCKECYNQIYADGE